MNKKRSIGTAIAVAALGALVYSQFRTWKSFDWEHFWQQTRGVNLGWILLGVVAIYLTYVLRAMRWKVFLRPVRKTSSLQLVGPTLIGFTGLALLGRPGEFVRPYLIARREGLTLASQMGVWAVERIFDVGIFAVLLIVDILLSSELRRLRYFQEVRDAGYALLGVTLLLAVLAFLIWKWTDATASLLKRILQPFSPGLASNFEHKVRTFGRGLHTLHDLRSFIEAAGLSCGVWLLVACAYMAVMHAYPAAGAAYPAVQGEWVRVLPHEMKFAHLFPLIASSMAGSIVQLPAVGGGSQLAVITVLVGVFDMPRELAVSCGILLWMVTFMACVPAGLALARREHVSLRALSQQSQSTPLAQSTGYNSPQPEPGDNLA